MVTRAVPTDVVWSVAAVSFFVAILSAAAIVNGPLVYVLIMERFDASHEAASWVGSATTVVTHLNGFLVTLLELRLSLYQITLMAATLLWVALLASAFATSTAWISTTLVFHGGAAGVIFLNLSIYIAAYFDKYRAVASGIKFGGWALAGLISPPAFSALLSVYGFIGVFVLYAAISMHATPLIMLLKNPPIINFRQDKKQNHFGSEIKRAMSASKYCFTEENILQQDGSGAENGRAATNATKVNLKPHKPVKSAREANPMSKEGKDQTPHNNSEAISKTQQNPLPSVISGSRMSFWNVCGPLRKAIFYAFVPALICCDYDELVSQLTIVDYAMDKGWERGDTTPVMMCLSVGSLIGRLLLPLLADFGFFTRTTLMSACYTAFAAVFLAMPHVVSFHGVILLCVVSGAAAGCAISLKPVLIADYLGTDQIAPAIGVTGIIMTPLLIANPAILGFFRDQLGSYDNYYRLVAGINVFVAGTLLAVVVYEMRKKRAKVAFA